MFASFRKDFDFEIALKSAYGIDPSLLLSHVSSPGMTLLINSFTFFHTQSEFEFVFSDDLSSAVTGTDLFGDSWLVVVSFDR